MEIDAKEMIEKVDAWATRKAWLESERKEKLRIRAKADLERLLNVSKQVKEIVPVVWKIREATKRPGWTPTGFDLCHGQVYGVTWKDKEYGIYVDMNSGSFGFLRNKTDFGFEAFVEELIDLDADYLFDQIGHIANWGEALVNAVEEKVENLDRDARG